MPPLSASLSQVVQHNASHLLSKLSEADMGHLPSGLSLYSILQQVEADSRLDGRALDRTDNRTDNRTNNATSGGQIVRGAINAGIAAHGNVLVQMLARIPPSDLLALQKGVEVASRSYRYYLYNSSMDSSRQEIPTRYDK